jgi:hypothetical protein
LAFSFLNQFGVCGGVCGATYTDRAKGRVEANEKEKVVELLRKFMEDVMEQLREDNADAIRALPTAAKTDLNAKLRAECKQIIVQHFKDLAAERKAV